MNKSTDAEKAQPKPFKFNPKELLKCSGRIIVTTSFVGALSYGFILLNKTMLKMTIPDSLWCALAICLAVVYYLFQRADMNAKDAEENNWVK